MRLFTLVLLLLSVTAPALAQEEGAQRAFKDWMTACRDDGYCSAFALANPRANGNDADYVLRVGRHAERSYWEISFKTVAVMADEWNDFTVTVDGVAQPFSGFEQIGAYAEANDFFLLGDGAQAVLGRMVPGSQVSIAFSDRAEAPHTVAFSLSGLAAALIWIDEQQKRLGSERVASAPPYGLTPAGSSQSEPIEIPAALLDRLRADPECEPLETLANGRDFQVGRIDAEHTLYVLPCWSGAYNFGSKVFVMSGPEGIEAQYFPAFYPHMGMVASSYLVNASYDEATRTMNSYAKSRGAGDCGSSGTWTWTDFGFALTTFNYRQCEDDIREDGDPGDFPLVYDAATMSGK